MYIIRCIFRSFLFLSLLFNTSLHTRFNNSVSVRVSELPRSGDSNDNPQCDCFVFFIELALYYRNYSPIARAVTDILHGDVRKMIITTSERQ